jgi:hypothetical protein
MKSLRHICEISTTDSLVKLVLSEQWLIKAHRKTFGEHKMKRIAVFTLLLVVVFGAVFAFMSRPAVAQDEMMSHSCDSTLITLLLIAEYDYGFQSMMDTANFDKGQYAPLFEAMMMDMEEPMMESTEEAMMEEPMMDDMMMLSVGNIEGEDPACAELRAELDAFFYAKFTEMMAEEGM